MFLAIDEYDEEESIDTNQETDSNPQENESSVEFLRNLAAIAPTHEVRELLFSIIDGIAEELLPAFEFAKLPNLGDRDWVFDYGTDDVSITQCKSWFKKFMKWCHDVGVLLKIAKDASDNLKGIKQNFDDMKASNNYHDQRYIDPNYTIN